MYEIEILVKLGDGNVMKDYESDTNPVSYTHLIFLEEHDPSDKQGFIDFLTPYYEKAKQLANIERNI